LVRPTESANEARDLRLVLVIGGEQGSQRPIDLAGRHGLLVARPSFPLDEPARELPGRICLRPVFDGKREERQAGLFPLRHRRHQHYRITILGENRPVRLPRHATRLKDQLPAREFLLNPVCHLFFLLFPLFSSFQRLSLTHPGRESPEFS